MKTKGFVFSLKGEKPGQEEKLTMEVSGGEPYMRSSRSQPKRPHRNERR